MATDIKKILENLFEFYDFSDKTIISVGAGGGQFIEYGHASKEVIAIDNDNEALNQLADNLQKKGLTEKFRLVHSDFYLMQEKGDVVMFEFCLHEMEDSEAAIHHALTMAPEVLITDHWPGSQWAYVVDEKEKVMNSWSAVNRFTLKRAQRYDTVQFFHNYDELFQKVNVQGETAITRIKQFQNKKEITIQMSYGFALI